MFRLCLHLVGLVLFFVYGVEPFTERAGFGMENPLYWVGGFLFYVMGVAFMFMPTTPSARSRYDDDY